MNNDLIKYDISIIADAELSRKEERNKKNMLKKIENEWKRIVKDRLNKRQGNC